MHAEDAPVVERQACQLPHMSAYGISETLFEYRIDVW
jgi:hypothetical protein